MTDFKTWKAAYDAFDSERRTMGVIGDAAFQSHERPNEVTAWHDFATIDAARSFSASDRLKQVMADAGVAGAPQVEFTSPA